MAEKSEFTICLDDRLKERAKRSAKKRRTSVSRIVEGYFCLLLREPGRNGSDTEFASDNNTVRDALSPRIRHMVDTLDPAKTDLSEETEAWLDAMHKKHQEIYPARAAVCLIAAADRYCRRDPERIRLSIDGSYAVSPPRPRRNAKPVTALSDI